MTKYGVYIPDDDEMFVMSKGEALDYIYQKSDLCQNFSVYTDGEKVKIYEPSAGPNGKLDEMSVDEFLRSFEENGIIIRKISEYVRT